MSLTRLAPLVVLLATSACTSIVRATVRSYDVAPNGLSRADDAFRRSLVTGGFTAAFARSASPRQGAPDDALLRALYRGATGYYAGETDASIAALTEADRIADRRQTESLSRGALSLVVNDGVLPYRPSRTEALFIPYYAMLAALKGGRTDAALVEARRLGQRLEACAGNLSAGERALHAALRETAGAVFESAGETNDALVSYRNAALLRGATRQQVDSIRLRPPSGDSATLLLVVESGFVAHRVDRGFTVGLDEEFVSDSVAADSSGVGPVVRADRESSLASRIAAALEAMGDDDGGLSRPLMVSERATTFVRIAWPSLRRSWARPDGFTFGLASTVSQQSVQQQSMQQQSDPAVAPDTVADVGSVTASPTLVADVSDAIAADMRRDRAAEIARLVIRTSARAAATRKLRQQHGQWAGVLASAAAGAVERADTRSWGLLPASITLVRTTIPAGAHQPVLSIPGHGTVRRMPLDAMTVARGELRVVATRLWRDPLNP